MSRYPGVASLLERAAAQTREQKNADAIGRKAQAVKRAALDAKNAEGRARSVDARVARDDGIAPLAPSAFTATPTIGRQLDFAWAQPPDSDYVSHSIVEYTPQGETARQIRGTALFAYAMNLEPKAHSVRARFVDRWGRLGAWSSSLTVTPKKTVAEYIDVARTEILGKFGWTNIAQLTDATNIADDVITARNMATQNLAAMRLWVGDAAIDSAMIRELSVDKLTAGTFTAGQITLAGGGSIKAGGTIVDELGVTMPVNRDGNNNLSKDRELGNAGGWAKLFFFDDGTHRGTHVRSIAGGDRIAATYISASPNQTARDETVGMSMIELYAEHPLSNGRGRCEVNGDFVVKDRAFIYNEINIDRMNFLHANGTYKRIFYNTDTGNLFINV